MAAPAGPEEPEALEERAADVPGSEHPESPRPAEHPDRASPRRMYSRRQDRPEAVPEERNPEPGHSRLTERPAMRLPAMPERMTVDSPAMMAAQILKIRPLAARRARMQANRQLLTAALKTSRWPALKAVQRGQETAEQPRSIVICPVFRTNQTSLRGSTDGVPEAPEEPEKPARPEHPEPVRMISTLLPIWEHRERRKHSPEPEMYPAGRGRLRQERKDRGPDSRPEAA